MTNDDSLGQISVSQTNAAKRRVSYMGGGASRRSLLDPGQMAELMADLDEEEDEDDEEKW